MHGLGNDFILFDAPAAGAPGADTIRRLADRFTGIGFDQALMLEPPRRPGTAVYYRIFNADGREVEQCGNGARCIARFLRERSGDKTDLVLDSPGGLVQTRMNGDQVSVTMGVPDFEPASLPFEASGEAYVYPLSVGASDVEIGAVSVGNPHAVIRVPVGRRRARSPGSAPRSRITRGFRSAPMSASWRSSTGATSASASTSAARARPAPAAPAPAPRSRSAAAMACSTKMCGSTYPGAVSTYNGRDPGSRSG